MPGSLSTGHPSSSPRAGWEAPGLELGRWGQIKASFPSGFFVLCFYKEEGVGPKREEGPSALSPTLSLPSLAGEAVVPPSPAASLLMNGVLGGARGRGATALSAVPQPPPGPRSLGWHRARPPGTEPAIDRWMLC